MSVERVEPGPGQESVWDYPRPPRIEAVTRRVRVEFGGEVVADSVRALRVVETSSPPCYYVPSDDVRLDLLDEAERVTFCEFKGRAAHFDDVAGGRRAKEAAWSYRAPNRGYEQIAGFVAFYPARVEACYLDDELVRPQPGKYYGGWITDDVLGPFKGDPGTERW